MLRLIFLSLIGQFQGQSIDWPAARKGAVKGIKVTLMIFGGILILTNIYLGQPTRLVYNSSWSLDKGFYLAEYDDMALERNGLVYFQYHAPEWVVDRQWPHKPEHQRYLKRVAGLPGDRLIMDGLDVYVCQNKTSCEMVASRLPTDRFGLAWEDLNIPHIIPKDYYFLVGDHPGSFDSRYLGLIPHYAIIGTAEPLWTRSIPQESFSHVEINGIPHPAKNAEYVVKQRKLRKENATVWVPTHN